MADKIQKTRSSRKVSADSALSLHIAVFGAPAPMPCTNCFRNSRTCIVASNSKRCKECIDRKVACDGTDFAGPLTKSIEEVQHLQDEEDKLHEQLLALNCSLLVISQRKRAARSRADELFKRGSLTMEANPASFEGLSANPSSTPSSDPLPHWDISGSDMYPCYGSAEETVEASHSNSSSGQ